MFFLTDSSDSVSRELVEAGLVDGKDMIVGEYFFQNLLLNCFYKIYCTQSSLVSHGTVALNVSNMEKIKYRNSPSVVVHYYFS